MRIIFFALAVLALLFVLGFGGLRGFEQYRTAGAVADATAGASEGAADDGEGAADDGEGAADEGEIAPDDAIDKGLRAFSGWPDDEVSALLRGAIAMMALALLALLTLIALVLGGRASVVVLGIVLIGGAVATWIVNPDLDLGPVAGFSQDLIDMGPMSADSPKMVAMLLGGCAVAAAAAAFVAVAAAPREAS